MKDKGFTLVEIMVASGLLVVLSMSVFFIMSRSLSSSARVENQRLLDENAKFIINSLTKFFREGQIVSVGVNDRDQCSEEGVSGDFVVVKALDGEESTIEISDGKLSSRSAETITLHSDSIDVSELNVMWKCVRGLSDQLDLEFRLKTSEGLSGDVDPGLSDTGKSYSLSVLMRNRVD